MPAISRNGKFLTKTKTQADIGGVSSVRLYEKQAGSQGASSYKVFTMSGSYVPGSNTLVVYVNGQKAERVESSPANATQYVETSEKVITFGASLQATDIVEFAIYGSYNVNGHEWNTNTYETTLTEASASVTLPFNPNAMISIYIDGVRQQSSAYTLSGTSVTFDESLPIGTELLFVSPNTDDIPLTNADTIDGYHAIQLMTRRNVIINGNGKIFQRGSSFSVTSGNSAFPVDRFRVVNATDGTISANRMTETVTQTLRTGLYVSPTVADTSLTAAQAAGIQYVVEGYDIQRIIGQVCTLSFWAKTTYAGTYCIGFTNYESSSTDRSYVAEVTLPADLWVYRTITFTMHDLSSGSYWNTTNGGGLRIWFGLAAGSDFITGTTNSWVTGNYVSTSNQVNFMGATSRTFSLTGVQLEVGEKATDYEYKLFSEEVALCQRYYEKSYALTDNPGASTAANLKHCTPITGTLTRFYLLGSSYLVPKRSTPSSGNFVIYSQDGTSGSISVYNNSGSKIAISSFGTQGENNFGTYFQSGSSGSSGEIYVFHFTADAEI